ncbi:hypothetical protein MTO96_029593 [Rhipicephalus appendiculatus]
MAFGDLYAVVAVRFGWEPTRAEVETYFSGDIETVIQTPASQRRSVWAEARKASRRLLVGRSLYPEDPRITCGDATLTSVLRCKVMRSLRDVLTAPRDQALQDLPNQGTDMVCVGEDPASCHFLRTGTATATRTTSLPTRTTSSPLPTPPALLQERINLVEALATPLGLALNPAKCSSLNMCGATPVGMRPTTFTVSGVSIQPLRDHQPQRFLGRPVGFRLPSRTGSIIDGAISQARAIFSSLLAPWQRLDGVRTFVHPALNVAMRCGVLTKTDWRRFDDAVRLLVKRTLYLPGNASTHYIYGSAAAGAAAIPVAGGVKRHMPHRLSLQTPDHVFKKL